MAEDNAESDQWTDRADLIVFEEKKRIKIKKGWRVIDKGRSGWLKKSIGMQ
jgi:hypothetical protein